MQRSFTIKKLIIYIIIELLKLDLVSFNIHFDNTTYYVPECPFFDVIKNMFHATYKRPAQEPNVFQLLLEFQKPLGKSPL